MRLKFLQAFLFLWAIVSSLGSVFSSAQVTAQFKASPQTGCDPLFVTFSNTSTGTGILTYTWDFGNGNTSNLKSPSQTYNSCGNYVVTLTVTNGSSTATDTAHITVYCKPTVTFTYSNSNGCPGTCVTFTNTSNAGSGTITNIFWDFGDGNTSTANNPTHCYLSPGNFNVTLTIINSFGCTNSSVITNAITIYNPPVANFTGTPTALCSIPATVNFNNSSTGTGILSYKWNFGDPSSGTSDTSSLASPNHIYNAFGAYTVSLIVTDGNGCTDTLTLPNYINVGSLSATITTTPSNSGCCPFIVHFSETSSGTPTGYLWNFGGGIANSSIQNPVINFPCPAGNNPKVYNVTLTETFAGGCTATATTTITVDTKPTANFTSGSTLSTCILPDVVVFNNTSTGAAGTTYKWFFGDGDSSLVANPAHTYTTCGSYTVMLIATNLSGCTDTLTQTSFVNLTCPVASFNSSPMGGCVPVTANFNSDSSTGNPVSWSWNFGDPSSGASNTSTSQNPSHTYTQTGCYNVTLVTTNAQGCTDSITKANAVCAGNPPTANFSANPTLACAQLNIDFTSLSTGVDSFTTYLWNFGDGRTSNQENPTHIYSDTGFFTVSLLVCNAGCCDSVIFVNYIHILPPIANIAVTTDCKNPYNVCFDGSHSIGANTYEWNFDDPASGALDSSNAIQPCHIFPDTGNYSVTLTVYNDSTKCTFTQTSVVQIRKILAAFTVSAASGCTSLSVTTTNSSTGASSYQWTVIDSAADTTVFTSALATPSFTFANGGTYLFQLVAVDTNGCADTATSFINLFSSAINAYFDVTPSIGCMPLDVQFTDISTSKGGPIVSWLWDFGDPTSGANNSSRLQNPSHIYKLPGCYRVGLLVTDSLGCTGEIFIASAVCVNASAANFTASDSNGCIGNLICFTGLPNDSGYLYSWNFGDTASGANDSSVLVNPCHVYNDTGVYTVSLKVITINGCDSTIVKPNYIKITKPVADFGAQGKTSSICPPLLVNFIDSSHSNITSWQWNFGDGNTSTNQNPSHVYSISGSYTVTLIVTNTFGCTDTLVKTNYVVVQGPTGSFTFTPDIGCSPLDVCFKATTSTTANLTFIWNYGNTTSGPILNGDSICFIYTLPGIYHPSLILQDSAGCEFSINSPDSVWVRGPKAKFVMDDNPKCGSGTVQFTDSTSTISKITSWNWDFGDPSSGTADTSSLQNPTHTYNQAGKYNITLTITTQDGCVNSYSDTLTIFPTLIPIIDAVNSPVCIGGTIIFKDSSISAFKLVSWLWNFGDTASGILDTSTQQNTSHQYKNSGQYAVKLIIVDTMGCRDSITNMVTINPLPNANAGPNQKICIGSSTTLNATGGVTFSWTPTATLSNSGIYDPVASPTIATTYTVLVTDANGCKNTDSVVIGINPLPIDSVSPTQKICYGSSTSLFAKGGVSYSWAPSTGLSNTTVNNPIANPTAATTYIVTVTDSNGCKSNDSVIVKVNPPPPANAGPNQNICIGNSAKLNGSGGKSYSWSSNPTGFASASDSATVTPTITTQYILEVTDTNGCTAGDTTTVFVHPLPIVSVNSNFSLCIGSSKRLNANGGVIYLWTPTAGLSNVNISDPLAQPTTTTTYTVLVTDINGCKNSDSLVINVNPLPIDSVSPAQKICNGSSTTLFATGGVDYSWSPSTGLSNSTISNPVANPTISTTYSVTIIDTNGCENSNTVTVTVNPLPTANAGLNQNICLGGSATLNGSGGVSYAWTSNPPGFSSTASSTVVTPSVTTQYILNVEGANGCKAGDTTTVFVHPLPIVTISNALYVCLGSAIQLTAAGGAKYVWSPSAGLNDPDISNPFASPKDTTTYVVTVTDSFGCVSDDSVRVNVIFPFKAKVVSADTICAGGSVQLDASGGVIYRWSPANTLNNAAINDPIATPTISTVYTVIISDSICFSDTGNVYVDVYPDPSFSAGKDQTILAGQSVVLGQTSPTFSGTFSWTPQTGLSCNDCQNPVATPDSTTKYIVTLTSQDGCITTDSVVITITILCAEDDLFIPNAFTPNGDGLNDIFYVRSKGIRQLNYFRVFDRWGELLFETDDIHIGWDGTYKGRKLPPAVYVYDVSAVCSSGDTITKKGNVTLIR